MKYLAFAMLANQLNIDDMNHLGKIQRWFFHTLLPFTVLVGDKQKDEF